MVRAQGDLTTDGHVEDVQLVDGEEPFTNVASQAVRKWRYQPAQFKGETIAVRASSRSTSNCAPERGRIDMQFSSDKWHHMGAPAITVASVLMLMGLTSLTVFVERVLHVPALATGVAHLLVGRRLERWALRCGDREAEKHKHSHLARVFRAARSPTGTPTATADVSALTPVDHTHRHIERYMEEIGERLRSGLGVLASVGSIAPFVGLLGTVLGIISRVPGHRERPAPAGSPSVSAGISEALIETAFGLAVAIPAVLAFNYLSTKIAARGDDAATTPPASCSTRIED